MQIRQFFLNYLKWSAVLLVLSGFFLTGCENKKQAQAPHQAPPAPEVVTMTVETRKITLTTELPGRTSALRVAEIRPQINGLIQKRLFEEGAEVKAGQLLYEIDPAMFQAALDNASANLAMARESANQAQAALEASLAAVTRQKAVLKLARTNSRRFQELLADKAVSASQRDQYATEAEVAQATLRAVEAQVESDRKGIAAAAATIQQAEAALKSASINMEYTRIVAPISGHIGKSNITEGSLVTAYQPVALATIQQLDPIYVDVTQSTTELLHLRQRLTSGNLNQNGSGQNQVSLLLEDGTIYSEKGVLQFQDVTVDPTTGSVILRIVFPNPDNMLLPGMFVRAVVKEGTNDQAILIPQQAVSRDPKGNPTALIVTAANKVEQVGLTLDRSVGDKWFVTSGLKPGDRVIVEGLQKVRPGAAVRIAQAPPSSPPQAGGKEAGFPPQAGGKEGGQPAEKQQNPDKTPAPSK